MGSPHDSTPLRQTCRMVGGICVRDTGTKRVFLQSKRARESFRREKLQAQRSKMLSPKDQPRKEWGGLLAPMLLKPKHQTQQVVWYVAIYYASLLPSNSAIISTLSLRLCSSNLCIVCSKILSSRGTWNLSRQSLGKGFNRYNPSRVLTLDKTTYTQFAFLKSQSTTTNLLELSSRTLFSKSTSLTLIIFLLSKCSHLDDCILLLRIGWHCPCVNI